MLDTISKRWRWLGLGGAALVSLALALYLTQTARTDPAIPFNPDPQVAGRLMDMFFGESEKGSLTGFCEYDAWARISGGDVVVEVQKQGQRRQVKVGDPVAGLVHEPPVPDRARGEARDMYELTGVGVYWGADGKLHGGCAPESLIILDSGEQRHAGDPDLPR